jgi:hypothetical protein
VDWATVNLDPTWRARRVGDQCAWWLGVHHPSWSWNGNARGPLFLSARVLRKRKSAYPRATVPIAIDSGGYTELTKYGRWTIPADQYAAEIRSWSVNLGTVAWAAIQDWVCSPDAMAMSGLTVAEHQRRTTASYLELVSIAPAIQWLPVVQGITVADYLRHVDGYARAGIDLRGFRLVGLGSVVSRSVAELKPIVGELAHRGLRLHGFGVKGQSLAAVAPWLRSADSMAWSFLGRRLTLETGLRDSQGRGLANSPEYAERFRAEQLAIIERSSDRKGWTHQMAMPW